MLDQQAQTWRCTVCGYVHHGSEPPAECPVCGASKDEFELFEETTSDAPSVGATNWQCLICGYLHTGAEPPEVCPVCAASRNQFEPVTAEASVDVAAGDGAGFVIVGGGIAGVSAAEAVRAAGATAPVTLLSKEPRLPYHRLNLTRFVAGEIADESELALHPESWYAEQGIELKQGAEVAEVVPSERRVILREGSAMPYEKLILTAGAHPFMPPLAGLGREGVTAFRTVADAQYILSALESGKRCVVIGGGILGLESAAGLAKRGAQVTILEGFDWLLPRQLNRRGGEILENFVRELGIEVRPRALTKELTGDERVRGVLLEDGSELDADLVVIAVGIRTNSYLGRQAGLEVDHGLIVDDHLRTSAPDVFAAGDLVEHRGVVAGLWGPAQYQGAIAGRNAAGQQMEYGGIPRATTMKVVGLPLFSVGEVRAEDGSYRDLDAQIDSGYQRFLFRDNRLVGAILLGDTALSAACKQAVETGQDFSPVLRGKVRAADVADYLA